MRGIYLGPDDRYPPGLYWAPVIMLLADTAIQTAFLVALIHHPHGGGGDDYLDMQNKVAHVCAVACPLIVASLVVMGMPSWTLIFIWTQVLMLLSLTGQYLGM